MNLSIIITSYKRPFLLECGLKCYLNKKGLENIEFLVINDGVEDETEDICLKLKNHLNINYYFTGQRNNNSSIWRCPGYAINFGVTKTSSDNILLSCAEMYYVDDSLDPLVECLEEDRNRLVVPNGFDDDSSVLKSLPVIIKYKDLPRLNVNLPFFMLMDKNKFVNIGGYDEDFIGIGYDDNDIVDRLTTSGSYIYNHNSYVIHLYHSRSLSNYSDDFQTKYDYNKNLYLNRKGLIERNIGKEWGRG